MLSGIRSDATHALPLTWCLQESGGDTGDQAGKERNQSGDVQPGGGALRTTDATGPTKRKRGRPPGKKQATRLEPMALEVSCTYHMQ